MTAATGQRQESVYPAKLKYVGELAEAYVTNRVEVPTWTWEQEQVRVWANGRPKGSSVLDVPFGTGRYAPLYLDAGLVVHGADISADMVAVAKRELGEAFNSCTVQVADAENLAHLADGSVDAVLSSRFIQWLPDLAIVDRVLGEFARVAKEDLFLQLKLPTGAVQKRNTFGQRVKRAIARGPIASIKRLGRKLGGDPSMIPSTVYSHPEPEVLKLAKAHGWQLVNIGEECPTAAGVRFYHLRKG